MLAIVELEGDLEAVNEGLVRLARRRGGHIKGLAVLSLGLFGVLSDKLLVGSLDQRFLGFVFTVLLLQPPELLLDLLRSGRPVQFEDSVGIWLIALHLRGKQQKKQGNSEKNSLCHG